ncbi:MAG: M23 family metallopeptidase [Vicinamibacteria bacterium]
MTGTVNIAIAILVAAGTATSSPAFAARTGGASAPVDPKVTAVRCITTETLACSAPEQLVAGGQLRVTGRALEASRTLVFRGHRGRDDDVTARAKHVRSGHFDAQVPAGARSGPVDVISAIGARARAPRNVRIAAAVPEDLAASQATFFVGGQRRPAVTVSLSAPAMIAVEAVRAADGVVVARWEVNAPAGSTSVPWDAMTPLGPAPPGAYRLRAAPDVGARAAAAAETDARTAGLADTNGAAFTLADHIFPIRGRHDLGQSDTNNFGGARGHQGQDMFAACGTRLAAARAGTVKFAATDARAGNYVVITGAGSGLDYVYMHMRAPATVSKGQQVFTGQKIGEVGDSGNADGCHLHFELWRAPGWYTGGGAIDPLALLTAWDAAS